MSNVSPSGKPLGKLRSPLGVWLLTLVTFGIYLVYWWYAVNKELDDFDDEINISPVLSAIALFGVITTVVTIVRTGGRIGHAQKRAMGEDDTSGWLGLLLAFCATLNVAYYQAKLNKLWESQGATKA